MPTIVFLIEQIAIGLYVFIGLGILLSIRRLIRARREYRATRFELQRDFARHNRANALTALILLVEGGLFVFGMQQFVAPTLRATLNFAPQTQDIIIDLDFYTPTPAPLLDVNIDESSIELGDNFGANEIRITPTPTATPVGTIEAAPAAVGCDTPGAQLQIPANGQVIQGVTEVVGVAFTDNFGSFKIEVEGDYTGGEFATYSSIQQPVREMGVLDLFNAANISTGTYRFRLAVFDDTGIMRESCTVTIYIRPPSPTATPGGQ